MFYRETEFKDTEIGKIPKDWGVIELKDIGKLKDGDWILKKHYDENGEVRLLQVGDIGLGKFLDKSHRFISKSVAEELRVTYVKPKRHILISRMPDPIGRACTAPELPYPYIVAVDITMLEVSENLADKEFIMWFLNSDLNFWQIQQFASGATRNRVSRKNLEKIKIPLPPLEEQRKIAEILGTIDKAIQKTNEIIARTERLKKGLMQELLTKGLGHKEFKDTEIGRIPKDWKVVRLGDIAEKFISSGTPSTKEPRYWNGDIPWIRSVHITKYYIDKSMIEQYITKEGLENSASNIVPKGSLIVATRVGIGKSAVNLIDVAINQDLTGIVLNRSKVNPFYLVWYFHSPKIINLLEAVSRGTTIKGIPQDYIKKLLIPLPPLEEQKKIAQILSTVDKKLEIEKKRKRET